MLGLNRPHKIIEAATSKPEPEDPIANKRYIKSKLALLKDFGLRTPEREEILRAAVGLPKIRVDIMCHDWIFAN